MQEKDVYADLASIRNLMERSSKFISLSGLSGVLAGIYALIGARFAFRAVDNLDSSGYDASDVHNVAIFLGMIGLVVFLLSIVTCYWLSMRKAKKRNENVWNPVSRRMLAAIAFPMITGGLFVAILMVRGEYGTIASAFLIFYGLALIAASHYTYTDIKWLGIGEILLGLIALLWPGNGLILWTIGFGLLHILYGTIMYFKYER